MRAAPSPTPPTHIIPSRHLSTSDEDNNAFEEKEEVCKLILRNILLNCFIFTVVRACVTYTSDDLLILHVI